MTLCWSSHEGKCSSWICHSCLYEAVFSSTSYLLWAQTVIILTTQHTRLSGQPPLPVSSVSPYSDRWSKLPGTNSLYYASMLLQLVTDRLHASSSTTPLKCQRWADCSLMYTPAFNRWLYWVSKNSEPWKTWNWIMAFERLEKLNEKHQCVIVKTNKQFFGAAETDVPASHRNAAGRSRTGWRWAVRGGLLLLWRWFVCC